MNSAISHYYVTGGTMHTDAPSYVIRLADKELYENLKKGNFCYVLTSRQMGKSSLMIRTRQKLQEDGCATVVLDLTSLGQNLSVEQWYDGLLIQIGEQLDLEDELDDFWLKNTRLSCLQRWLEAIRKIVLPNQNSNLVIFIDEIDCVISLPFSTDEFFAGIRQLYNERSRNPELLKLDICLLGVVSPSDLISDSRTTPFNIGKRIELEDFTLEDTTPLIKGLNCNEDLGKEIMERVLFWTGGHPYLTQKLCRSIANVEFKSAEYVDSLCESIFLSAQSKDKDDNLIFVRDRILKSNVDQAELLHLYYKIDDGREVIFDRTNPYHNVLNLSGIITIKNNLVFIRNQIYAKTFDRDWILDNMPEAELRRQKEAYKAGAKRTIGISVTVSLFFISIVSFFIFTNLTSQTVQPNNILRGTIFDRDERALAMSVIVKSLYADTTEIDDIEFTANQIAKILKVNPKEIIKNLEEGKANNRKFVWIARKLEYEVYQEINNTLFEEDVKKNDLPKFSGLHWQEEQERKYPNQTLAANIIGFANSENLGLAGVEQSQEKILNGEIKTSSFIESFNRIYSQTEIEREPPKDVVLTISHSIQYKTEEALEEGIKRSKVKNGMAVVLDPKTGEILAMANYPSFDPNDFRNIDPKNFNNRAIQNIYTPGSLFTLVTYGAALEEGLIKPSDKVSYGGEITVGGHIFRDNNDLETDSYTEAFMQSSNVAAIKTGLQVGKDKFYQYVQKFGFGKKTGIELPAETSGIIRSPETWNSDSLASMSIGYEIGVTALQSTVAFAAIANDGVKVQPHIIKEIRQSDGKTISQTQPKKERIVSIETARELREMLRQVVLNGTGETAQLTGYTSAGKTGTAWKYDPEIKAVNKNKYISSFIGFAPAENPQVVIAVVIDEPQGSLRTGGQVAAPIFRDIAEQILSELNVPSSKD